MPQSLRVVSVPTQSGAADTVLAVIYDDKRYLFNCGEGTQRLLLARKLPIKRFNDIFLSSTWESHGGLAGFLLGLGAESGYPHIAVHGPQNLAYYLATLRAGLQRTHRYTDGQDFQIEEYVTDLPPVFEDTNVKVQAILTHSSNFEAESDSTVGSQALEKVHNIARSVWTGGVTVGNKLTDGEMAGTTDGAKTTSRKRPFSQLNDDADERQATSHSTKENRTAYAAFLQFLNSDLPSIKQFPAAVSYCIEGQPRPGRFDVQRASACGVPKGPMFGRLQRGETVTLADGTTVCPQDVMGPERLTAPALIANCPNLAYLDNFLQHRYWMQDNLKNACGLVIHTGSPEVVANKAYTAWMDTFGPSTTHFLAHHAFANAGDAIEERSHAHYLSLQAVNPEQYPVVSERTHMHARDVLKGVMSKVANIRLLKPDQHLSSGSGAISKSTPMTDLLPKSRFKLEIDAASRERPEVLAALRDYEDAVQKTASRLQHLAAEPRNAFAGDEVNVVTLGTGSAGPSIYRNVAGTLIRCPDGMNILLDCGEDTLGQVQRAFGMQAQNELRMLRLVYISHLHADHQLGLLGILRQWLIVNAWNEEKLVLLAPHRLLESIREYDNIESLNLHRICMQSTSDLYHSRHAPPNTSSFQEMQRLLPQLSRIETVPAIHSEKSTCVRIDHRDGWSVAFSGDTRPSVQFMKLGLDVTCLIHEATFQNSKLDEAVKKRHSTFNEALLVGQEMRAKVTILTHFSQRYPKLPVLEEDGSLDFSSRSIVCANDLMHVKLKNAWKNGHYLKDEIELERRILVLQAQGTLPVVEEDEAIVNE